MKIREVNENKKQFIAYTLSLHDALPISRERVRESSLATNLVFSRVCEEFDNQL